ncbi:MAG: hypothetical protein GY727_05970 [Gammaproteobacteria bacterium]|nr:hypothetical protein [Gammaproteobacteria bacterium]
MAARTVIFLAASLAVDTAMGLSFQGVSDLAGGGSIAAVKIRLDTKINSK